MSMSPRQALFVTILGLAALGATCKGKDVHAPPADLSNASHPGSAAAPPDAAAAPKGPAAAEPAGERPQITEIEGLDMTAVDPARRADFMRLLNDTYCYCGCPRTLAACLTSRKDCSCPQCSERMVRFIVGELRSGLSTEEVESELLDGFSRGYNGPAHEFDLTEQPATGSAGPRYTLVEFADFRCPHCAAAFPILEEFVARHPDVRLSYFYFPLGGGGEASLRAAEAAEEARLQGKFWEYARLLFANQTATEEEDLLKYARAVGLDIDRFQAALKSHAHRNKVMANKRLGESVQVASTPSIFFNGRPFGFARSSENLEMRLQMESERGRCD